MDKDIYINLLELDTRLGTTSSEQLYCCLDRTTRSDIIKVWSFPLMKLSEIFQLIDLNQVNQYVDVIRYNVVGFAHFYLEQCRKKTKSDDEIDIEVYTELVELDTILGTTASEQLFACIHITTRSDIIKVAIFAWM